MSRKEAIGKKIAERKKKVLALLNSIYHGEATLTGAWHKIVNAAKVVIVAARKFIKDDCFTKASSITYTIILSLVPMLAVALTLYSWFVGVGRNKKELFDKIVLLMAEYNIKMNIDPIIDTILGLVENAGKIGGISAVIMIFSATALFRSLDKSLNGIWSVRKGRPILMKIIYYWAALTLGPMMLAAGMFVATQLSTVLSSPNYNAAAVAGERIWVVGNKATVLSSIAGRAGFKTLDMNGAAVDYENQKAYRYDPDGKSFSEQDAEIEPRVLKKAQLRGIHFIGEKGWIVGTDGIVLHTSDGGAAWGLRKFHDFNYNAVFMLDAKKGFIAAEGGRVLATADGGASWEVMEWEGQPSFTSIAFRGNTGVITGARGNLLRTVDGGTTWEQQVIQAARRQNRYANLSSASLISEKEIWLAGGEGTLLYSGDSGKTWTPRKFKDTNYLAAYFFTPEEGVAGGDKGIIARTADGGATWDSVDLPMIRVNAVRFIDDRLWAIGDAGTIMASADRGATWTSVMQGKTFAYTLINFLAPFAIIWLLFLVAYIALPNTRVPFKPAALGASFTSAVWVLFIMGFIVYVKSFAGGTFAIYGALAAIPLFLLMIYASSLIILYGAEVAYTLMYPESYRSLKKAFSDLQELHVYHGITLLRDIYGKFESGGGSTAPKELRRSGAGIEEADRFIRLFLDRKLIITDDDGGYLPSTASAKVGMNDVIDAIMQINLSVPAHGGASKGRNFLAKLFGQIASNRRTVIGNLTLKELVDRE